MLINKFIYFLIIIAIMEICLLILHRYHVIISIIITVIFSMMIRANFFKTK